MTTAPHTHIKNFLDCRYKTNTERLIEKVHVCIDLQKGNIRQRRCKQRKQGNYSRWEMCNLPLCQPQHHNKVIKSDSFLVTLAMTSIHHWASIFTAYQCVNHSILLTSQLYQDCPESEINYLTRRPPTPKLSTLFCFLAFTRNMKFMM